MNTILSATSFRTALVLSLAAASAAAQSVMSQNHEVVIAVGDPAPGIPGSIINVTSNFDSPVMDQNGTMLFRARVIGGTATGADDRAYFLGRGKNDLQMVVRAGDQAPGLPAGILLRSSSATAGSVGLNSAPRISPFGEYLFFMSSVYDPVNPVNTPTTADTALFWGPVGNILPLAREGDPIPFLAPGLTWGNFAGSLQYSQINASGQVVFHAIAVGAPVGEDGILVTGAPGALQTVVREGDVLPTGEVVIPASGATQMTFLTNLNEAGQVLHELRFSTTLPSTATTADDRALAIWTGGATTIVVRENQQAPGLPAGVLFGNPTASWTPEYGNANFTRSGKFAFGTSLIGAAVTPSVDDRAVYLRDQSGLVLIHRRGDAAPGLTGALFGVTNGNSITCNDAGEVAFINTMTGANVTTTDDSSMWVGSAGNLRMIAREGDVVSCLPASLNGPWRFEQINGGSNNPLLNGRGDVLFNVSVNDGTAFKTVLLGWRADLQQLVLMLDATDTFTTALGGATTWTGLSSQAGFNSADGGQSHFTNSGDFAVRPSLTSGTAAIVRGHLGGLQANNAAISMTAGGSQTYTFDCGPARAFNIYVLLGSETGTRPGFQSPLGTQTIPLNLDAWTQVTLNFANTPVYANSLGFLDANGKGAASFNVPPALFGWAPTLHHAIVAIDGTLTSTYVSEPAAVRLY